MSTHVTELFKQASILSDEDRATLAGLLIESLESEVDPDVEEAWRIEIERRLAELDAGTAKTVPWENTQNQAFSTDGMNRRIILHTEVT